MRHFQYYVVGENNRQGFRPAPAFSERGCFSSTPKREDTLCPSRNDRLSSVVHLPHASPSPNTQRSHAVPDPEIGSRPSREHRVYTSGTFDVKTPTQILTLYTSRSTDRCPSSMNEHLIPHQSLLARDFLDAGTVRPKGNACPAPEHSRMGGIRPLTRNDITRFQGTNSDSEDHP